MKKGVRYVWTMEKTEDFLKRWHAGESVRSIAKHFECSDNVIVGHCGRLGLQQRPQGRPSQVTTGYNENYRRTRPESRNAVLASLIDTGFPTYSQKREVSINCSWIVSDEKPAQYCNAQARRGKSYCEDHCAVVFREPSPWEVKLLTGV